MQLSACACLQQQQQPCITHPHPLSVSHTHTHTVPLAKTSTAVINQSKVSTILWLVHVMSASIIFIMQLANTLCSASLPISHQYKSHTLGKNNFVSYDPELLCLQCFDAVGWAAGRASGL